LKVIDNYEDVNNRYKGIQSSALKFSKISYSPVIMHLDVMSLCGSYQSVVSPTCSLTVIILFDVIAFC